MRTNLFTRPVRLVVAGALALGGAGLLAACDVPDTASPAGETATSQAQDAKAKDAKPKATLSVQQQQAIRSAQNYLDTMGFSKTGLVKQLEFEHFSRDEAKAAIAALDPKPNWKDEAAQAAQNYLDTMGMSRAGLIEQLRFDGFTKSQAEHGADEVGL